ncbi:MAG: DUF2207 domain-containing protein, partial [Actinobacteria bacterium]|nr:DUF2207 domain-containing protein [Actinomycetota bacterium]
MPRRPMSFSSRPARRALLALLAVAALVLPACGDGKSYSFPEVRIDATVNQDGSLSIEEHRTFDFHGDFSFGYFSVEHKQFNDVVDFSVSEGSDVYEEGAPEAPGHVLLEDGVFEGLGGAKFRATWWFDAHDEQRTWTFRYRVLCAVDLFSDTAHLLWKFIGQGWTVPTDHAVITVHIPGRAAVAEPRPISACFPAALLDEGRPPPIPSLPTDPLSEGEIRAWGHGPLHGNVTIVDPQTVQLDIRDLVPEAFVEGSVTFPPETVPVLYQAPTPGLDAIVSEEGRLASQSNLERLAARRAESRRRTGRMIGWGFLIGMPLLTLLMAASIRRREAAGLPKHLSDPPEEAIRPARLAVEWSMYRRRLDPPNAFRAQLLELARQGAVEIRPVGTLSDPTDQELVLRSSPPDALDQIFTDALFTGSAPIRSKEFKPSKTQLKKLGEWWEKILAAARGSGASRVRRSMLLLYTLAFSTLYWSIPLAIWSGLPRWYPVLAQVLT